MSTPTTRRPFQKVYHKAKGLRADGAVSALCFANPRAIDITRAMWTITDKFVTCQKCLKIMKRGDA